MKLTDRSRFTSRTRAIIAMNPLETYDLDCPWCGEPLEILIDLSAGDQRYVEDCHVCCAPMVVQVDMNFDPQLPPQVTLMREGED